MDRQELRINAVPLYRQTPTPTTKSENTSNTLLKSLRCKLTVTGKQSCANKNQVYQIRNAFFQLKDTLGINAEESRNAFTSV
jgi:hypothetical protein